MTRHRWHRGLTLLKRQTVHPAAGRGGVGGHGSGSGMRCAGQGRSKGPQVLLGSREKACGEAGHVSHDGFLCPGGRFDGCLSRKSGVKASW